MKRYVSLVIVFLLSMHTLTCYSISKGSNMYINKRLSIQFKIPQSWGDDYKVVEVKNKGQYDIVVFKSRIKNEEIILLELWVVQKKIWNYEKDFYKLNKLKEYGDNIYAYSRPNLKGILENICEDVKKEDESYKKEVIGKYIDEKDIEARIHIKLH